MFSSSVSTFHVPNQVWCMTTRSERERRLQREETCKDKGYPNKKIRVFVWDEDDEGNFTRRRMTRYEIETDWEFIPDEHKIFNSVRGEYDICSGFAPDAEAPEVYWYDNIEPAVRDVHTDINNSAAHGKCKPNWI